MSAAAPFVPDMPGVHDVPFLTNTTMLALDHVPRHLVVVGGSYVGLEFAQMYRRFGAEVTIVEKAPRLIAREDEDVSEAIRSILEAEGITSGPAPSASAWRRTQHGVAVSRRLRRGPAARRSARTCCSRSAGGRTPTISGWTRPASRPTRAATSPSTTAWRPTCPGSGRSATATAAARSRTPPTTISRSSPPTCSTASTGRSAIAFRATRSTSIRRSAASG